MNKTYLLSPWCETKYRFPQNSLNYIKFYLLDHGYKAELIDCAHYNQDLNDVITKLKEEECPIIGVTAYTRERFNAYELIRKIKQEIPNSFVAVGGRHFGFLAEETLKELPEVDVVVRGEGEITFKEICDTIVNKKSFDGVLGISYKNDNEIIHNPDRPLEMDLDKFRNFDVNHLDDSGKYTLLFPTKVDNEDYIRIFATRGCAGRCVFCSLTANCVRFRSVDNVINEIEEKIKITGVRKVSFGDSSLTLKKSFVSALCEEIIKRKLNIKFNCYSRVDIDIEILKLMKKAGLVSVEIALESGSPRILKAIKKNIKIEQFEKFCQEAYRLGIKAYVFCMVSFPDEKIEDVDMTIALIKRLSKYIYYATVQTTRILPDAALFNIAKERNLIPKNFSWFKPFVETKDKKMFKNASYSTIPLYIEHMKEEEIANKVIEFNQVCKDNFIYMVFIKRMLKANFRFETFKNTSPKELLVKIKKAISLMVNAYKNRGKDSNFY